MVFDEPRTRAVAGLGLVVVLCSVAALWSLEEVGERAPQGAFRSPLPSAGGPEATAPVTAPRAPSPSPGQAAEGAWLASDPPALVARRLREAKSKREFFDRALAAGGGAHLYFARSAAVDCMLVSQRGMVGAEQLFLQGMTSADPQHHERSQAFRRQMDGCKGFELAPVTAAQLNDIAKRMAALDDPISLAPRLADLVYRSANREASIELARRLIGYGDPLVIKEVSMAMATLKAGVPKYGDAPESRRQREAWDREDAAWNLAACALMECLEADGRSDFLCMWSAKCGPVNLDEVMLEMIAPEQRPAVLRRRDEVVEAIRARNWSALGL